jgi:hypothetical protein
MHSGFEMLSYFYLSEWKFYSENTKNLIKLLENMSPIDSKNLNFDVSSVDWKILIRNSWNGYRKYLLKESDENIKKAKQRRQL